MRHLMGHEAFDELREIACPEASQHRLVEADASQVDDGRRGLPVQPPEGIVDEVELAVGVVHSEDRPVQVQRVGRLVGEHVEGLGGDLPVSQTNPVDVTDNRDRRPVALDSLDV